MACVVGADLHRAPLAPHVRVVHLDQTLKEVIAGCEAAWAFYGGVFRVLVPDNMKSIVDRADPTSPRLNVTFTEYAQARGFVIDPARVRSPEDKPRVERTVTYVRDSFFAGETFHDLADVRRRAEVWCRVKAGMWIHGTIRARPAEVFTLEEAGVLLPAPTEVYDTPRWTVAKVHRDHHIQVGKALYSIPGALIGESVTVGSDSRLVKVFRAGSDLAVSCRHPAWLTADTASTSASAPGARGLPRPGRSDGQSSGR